MLVCRELDHLGGPGYRNRWILTERLGLAGVLASKPCRERDLVLAMVASRIIAPHTKLATTRWWHTSCAHTMQFRPRLARSFGAAAFSAPG